MSIPTLCSPYLTAPPSVSRANERIRRAVWRRSLPQLRWRAKTAVGILGWGFMMAAGTYIAAGNGHAAFAGPLANGTALAAASPAPVTMLAAGPTGNLLPPGALAAYGTYRNNYTAGQCTWYVASRRSVPAGWGNARNWLANARYAGYATGSMSAVGAIAWTAAGYYGHVALVEEVAGSNVLISEMNYDGPYRIDERWVPATAFDYIY